MVSGINDSNPEVTVNNAILSRHATPRVRLWSIKSGNRVEFQHGLFRSLLSVARHSSGGAVILRGAGVLIGGLMMFVGPFFCRSAAARGRGHIPSFAVHFTAASLPISAADNARSKTAISSSRPSQLA